MGKSQGPGLRSTTFSVSSGSIGKGVRQRARFETKETMAIQASVILNLETLQGPWQLHYDEHEHSTYNKTIEQVLEQWN